MGGEARWGVRQLGTWRLNYSRRNNVPVETRCVMCFLCGQLFGLVPRFPVSVLMKIKVRCVSMDPEVSIVRSLE